MGAGRPREASLAPTRANGYVDPPRKATLILAVSAIVLAFTTAALLIIRTPNPSTTGSGANPRRRTRALTAALFIAGTSSGALSSYIYYEWKYKSIPATIRAQGP